jgi:hypothetical protein
MTSEMDERHSCAVVGRSWSWRIDSTATASELAGEHALCGQGYVAAPVFGNPDAAKARQLFVVAAGAAADVERCRPIFDADDGAIFLIELINCTLINCIFIKWNRYFLKGSGNVSPTAPLDACRSLARACLGYRSWWAVFQELDQLPRLQRGEHPSDRMVWDQFHTVGTDGIAFHEM